MATTKKTVKKVETPIDERETFVSLQKNFAESGAVEEKLKVLYNLQKADNEIEKLVQLRGELPAEVQALEEELERLRAKVARIEEAISEKNLIIEASKASAVEHDADIAKYSRQLEDISNSREYDSISKELENTNLLRQIDQKNIVEAKEKIEEYKQAIANISDSINIRRMDLDAKKEELEIFKLLLTVNGIGAKTALAILSSMNIPTFCNAIVNADIKVLKHISGIGPRSAERMIVELRDKIVKLFPELSFAGLPQDVPQSREMEDALLALEQLGFQRAKIQKTVADLVAALPEQERSSENIIRMALRKLNS